MSDRSAGNTPNDIDELSAYLARFVTDDRRARMEQVLGERTRYLTVVVEDVYQPHNASAVLRTCDCFGIQDVHIIENRNRYRLNPGVELGTAQWLTLHRYGRAEHNTADALACLRAAGYRIVATSPHADDVPLAQFDLEAGPSALLFGNELDGLSSVALDAADEHLVIPMYGFVESLNISVSAAIVLHDLSSRLRTGGVAYRLSPDEQAQIMLGWLRSSIGRADVLEREFHARRKETEA